MLTGPITILNWSFVREDITREQIAYQLAYALRQEVEALEQAGIGMIQVDEPAVREGLPLKEDEHANYLAWAVKAFRMSTCTVKDTTQIHTHMCYCEFHDMIDSIEAMDADVISIETSRSHGEMIHSFELNTYKLGIGLGVYDIHSPRVPCSRRDDRYDRPLLACAGSEAILDQSGLRTQNTRARRDHRFLAQHGRSDEARPPEACRFSVRRGTMGLSQ